MIRNSCRIKTLFCRLGYSLRLIYQDSTGVYGISGSNSYSGSCDGYIKTTIGGQYEAMKLMLPLHLLSPIYKNLAV